MHNHHVTNNSLTGGCSNGTWQTIVEPTCFAVHIKDLGYNTFFSGKYLNKYGTKNTGGVEHIPAGWDSWFGLVGNSKYYNYSISNNGKEETHSDNYYNDYYTDLIKNQSLKWLTEYNTLDVPFLMMMATPAAHGPFTPAPQYANASNATAPRIPNYNDVIDNKGKHNLFREYITTPMTAQQMASVDKTYEHRHETLMSVDDMINDIYNLLEQKGLLNNTYFVFFSDNGFHSGQFGQPGDKRQLYENDIRVPLYFSGPGIPKGYTTDMIGVNVDLGPTIIELAKGTIPEYMDGLSLVPYLFDAKYQYQNDRVDDANLNVSVKQQFLVEYYGESGDGPNGVHGSGTRPGDSWNNTYQCVRMIDGIDGYVNGTIYCQFKCFALDTHVEVVCPDSTLPQFYGEFYNLDNDYYEINNTMLNLSPSVNQTYRNMLKSFMSCSGQQECNSLRH